MKDRKNLQLKKTETNREFQFETADGLNSKNKIREEEIALLDNVKIKNSDTALVIQSNYGVIGTVLATKTEKVIMQDTSKRACNFSRKNCKRNQITNYEIKNTPTITEIKEEPNKILYAPKAYTPTKLVKKRINRSINKLKPKGTLHISGKTKTGIKRYQNHLKNKKGQLKTKKHGKIKIIIFKPSTKTKDQIDIQKQFKAKIRDKEAEFKTAQGLFSYKKIDQGTRILLKNPKIPKKPGKTLDLACGYAPIATFISKTTKPEKLYLTDDNARATKYAAKNLETNNVENHEIKTGDCLDSFKKQKFDTIISNPPTHQGKQITQKIWKQAHKKLTKNGKLFIVYNKNMKYEKQLKQKFDKIEEIIEKQNFRVTLAKKN